MGARNYGPVREVRRDGRVIWVIDFFWFDKSGRKQRYRRDAHIQAREGALLEARFDRSLKDRFVSFGCRIFVSRRERATRRCLNRACGITSGR